MDAVLAPLILDATLGRPDLPVARQALREFDQMRGTLTGPGILALFDAPWVPIYLLVCFLVHPWIGAVAVFGCLLMPLLGWINERLTRRQLDFAQRVAVEGYSHQDAFLMSAENVRALGMRRAVVGRQLRQREAMLSAQTQAVFATGNILSITKFVRMALQSLALGLGAWLAVDNLISAGAIFAASFLIARALQPVEQLISSWKAIVQARQSCSSIDALLADLPKGFAHTQLPPPRGAVQLEGVTVLNEARDGAIVHAVSLRIEPGEVVAIIGPSGGGKSTLVRAIAGAQLPDRGTVRFDDGDASDWDPERLAKHIGYLPQDSALFAGTVAENIARFASELKDDRAAIDAAIVKAAELVGAGTLIARLSNGYDHLLHLGGKGVSAGQAQRIALARAVYGDPAILILDEPNAHLDREGDVALIQALSALKAQGKTILIVSHKLGILPVVDKILVLRDGKTELFGPRDEVLAKVAPPSIRQMPKPPVVGAA
jgi:ATP-binding cassette subfamily C protein